MEASRLLRFSRQFERFYAARFVPLLERMGWNMAEVHVLLFLANNPGLDTARDIVALRGLAKSQVSQAVERLTDQGVLSRCPDEADRRIIHLAITRQGRPLVEEALAIQTGCGRALTEGLTPEETELLRSILKKAMDNVERLAEKETLE